MRIRYLSAQLVRACGEDEIMLNTKHKFTVFDAIVHVVNILIAVAILYPMVHLLAVSLSGYSEIMAGEVTILPKGFSLENYLYFWVIQKYFGLTATVLSTQRWVLPAIWQ